MDRSEQAYFEDVCGYLEAEIARLREESAALKRDMREAGKQFTAENPYGAVYQNPYNYTSEAGQHIAEMEKKLATAEADLAEAVLNEIWFHCPMQPLCRPDCRGLCPVCGENLNEHDCGHASKIEEERMESNPFAVLRNLKLDK